MPTLATGTLERGKPSLESESGFTLLELLIVMTIIGLMSAAVIVMMPDSRGSLRSEAERFAARAKAVQDRAIIEAEPLALRIHEEGYSFDRREGEGWRKEADYRWGEGTHATVDGQNSNATVFDSTGTSEPVQFILQRDEDEARVEIAFGGRISIHE